MPVKLGGDTGSTVTPSSLRRESLFSVVSEVPLVIGGVGFPPVRNDASDYAFTRMTVASSCKPAPLANERTSSRMLSADASAR
jgi:hypothetical protein